MNGPNNSQTDEPTVYGADASDQGRLSAKLLHFARADQTVTVDDTARAAALIYAAMALADHVMGDKPVEKKRAKFLENVARVVDHFYAQESA